MKTFPVGFSLTDTRKSPRKSREISKEELLKTGMGNSGGKEIFKAAIF
jgi:hypothetical protein